MIPSDSLRKQPAHSTWMVCRGFIKLYSQGMVNTRDSGMHMGSFSVPGAEGSKGRWIHLKKRRH